MNNYKIYTYKEFNERVKYFWNQMIKPDFPQYKCLPIQHDIAKRKTRTLGESYYKIQNGKHIPTKLSFSYKLLDGRYTIQAVDDIIKHEIGHAFDNYTRGYSAHDYVFKLIGERFNFDSRGTGETEKSEIYQQIKISEVNKKNNDYKYIVECPNCHAQWRYKSKCKSVKYSKQYICGCGHKGLIVKEIS